MFGPLALVAASLFAGAAFYINWAEHPARMALHDPSLLVQWKLSYAKGLTMQAGLAIIGGVLGLLEAAISGNWWWAIGGLAMLANWPYTLMAIMPVNHELNAIAPNDAGPASRALLERWNRLHAARTGLGALAVVVFLIAAYS